jgi:hypothetical protein
VSRNSRPQAIKAIIKNLLQAIAKRAANNVIKERKK